MKILDQTAIDLKVKRLSYEIWENNVDTGKLYFLGINKNGRAFAEMLKEKFIEISKKEVLIGTIILDPSSPIGTDITMDPDLGNLRGKSIVVIDDVANTGRTLFYAMKPIMKFLPKKVEVAVLVDRKHKTFPIKVDYVGISLATTLKENIKVDLLKKRNKAAFLE